MKTKQRGSHVRFMTCLPRKEALDVLRFADQKQVTVSELIRSVIVPLCKEGLER